VEEKLSTEEKEEPAEDAARNLDEDERNLEEIICDAEVETL